MILVESKVKGQTYEAFADLLWSEMCNASYYSLRIDFQLTIISERPIQFVILEFNIINFDPQTSVNMMTAAVNKVGVDSNLVPFGRIKREALIDSRKLLNQLGYVCIINVQCLSTHTLNVHMGLQLNFSSLQEQSVWLLHKTNKNQKCFAKFLIRKLKSFT